MPFSRAMFLTQGWKLGRLHCRQNFLPAEPPGKLHADVMLWKHRRSLALPSPLRNAPVEASRRHSAEGRCPWSGARGQVHIRGGLVAAVCCRADCLLSVRLWSAPADGATCRRRCVNTARSSPAPGPSLLLELTPDALRLVVGSEGGIDASTWKKLLLLS